MADQDLYAQAVDLVVKNNKPSISYIQRMLCISYNTAANYIEQMEAAGIVSAPNKEGKRTVLKK
ncbi:MAG: hypothetical protein J5613_03920 [Alphaproteobacteria bacterium]|nr:hypothetical protein [Alphaproteobacteria bacterium]MBR4806284.1 hypothetical protein [Alphaproteobacteria bacterium]